MARTGKYAVTPEMIEAGVIAEVEWLKKLPMTEATTSRMTAIYLAMRALEPPIVE